MQRPSRACRTTRGRIMSDQVRAAVLAAGGRRGGPGGSRGAAAPPPALSAAAGQPGPGRAESRSPGVRRGERSPRGVCVCVRMDADLRPRPDSGPLSACILILFSSSFGVFREQRGRAPGRDTRGPGRCPDGAGSQPGQPRPWKPGNAARDELCCTTVVSFRFPFPGCVVGWFSPGAGFVRVRLGLPGPLFARGMRKPVFLPLLSQLSVACLY